MSFPSGAATLPCVKSAFLAFLSAVLLIFAFPDFEIWPLALVGLIPLLWAVERERASFVKSFVIGWIFGICFFFGTCWWLTFAPITYAGFSPVLAYLLLFGVTVVAGLFPALFAGLVSVLVKRLGSIAILAAPLVWVFTEYLRYWTTGNNWNALGYSQAFGSPLLPLAEYGGVLLVSAVCVAFSAAVVFTALGKSAYERLLVFVPLLIVIAVPPLLKKTRTEPLKDEKPASNIVAVQPNVPMSGLGPEAWSKLRRRHVELAEKALRQFRQQQPADSAPTTVIFPESPMNFMFEEDFEFQAFISAFTARNNVNVLFNSAEPDAANRKYFNSAVLVDTMGKEIAQYDKIYLLPFGESVPRPLQSIIPAFVGSFSFGKEYDLLPLGDAKAGVVICFESHFGELSRRYVQDGADALIEMTNDGYLGPTPVLRQHLANAVFRAVETNRPLLRVTNVGITAYINESGDVIDPAESYTEAARVWSVSKSDGSKTLYVKYGEWFAWLSSIAAFGLIVFAYLNRSEPSLPSG